MNTEYLIFEFGLNKIANVPLVNEEMTEEVAKNVCNIVQHMKENSIREMEYTDSIPVYEEVFFIGDKALLKRDNLVHIVTRVYRNADENGETFPDFVIACSCDTWSDYDLKKVSNDEKITCPYCICNLREV